MILLDAWVKPSLMRKEGVCAVAWGMTRATPWADLDECIATLATRRDVLTRQIASLQALRALTDDRDVLLLLRYVVLGSKAAAADWANAQGWRLPGASGNDRRYGPTDVDDRLKHPPACVGADLTALMRDIHSANRKQVDRPYG
jgi:hypothetical protein